MHILLFNTGHHSYMFSVVHNSIQKITNISIMKPIILISLLNKYLNILYYLDNRTPLIHTHNVAILATMLHNILVHHVIMCVAANL